MGGGRVHKFCPLYRLLVRKRDGGGALYGWSPWWDVGRWEVALLFHVPGLRGFEGPMHGPWRGHGAVSHVIPVVPHWVTLKVRGVVVVGNTVLVEKGPGVFVVGHVLPVGVAVGVYRVQGVHPLPDVVKGPPGHVPCRGWGQVVAVGVIMVVVVGVMVDKGVGVMVRPTQVVVEAGWVARQGVSHQVLTVGPRQGHRGKGNGDSQVLGGSCHNNLRLCDSSQVVFFNGQQVVHWP